MARYILRLDDASEYMDVDKWKRVEQIIDKYDIKPIFGIIPHNMDDTMVSIYRKNDSFWELSHQWIKKGWIPAMHGYEHKYVTKCGGLNPVNDRSEFAGLSLEEQSEKIRKGWKILEEHNVYPKIFFAPSHTYDKNTLRAIRKETPIRIISDTPAWDAYNRWDFLFIPQQSGRVRNLPFKIVTFCYHPNIMTDRDFIILETFVSKNRKLFMDTNLFQIKRKRTVVDMIICITYFTVLKLRRLHN